MPTSTPFETPLGAGEVWWPTHVSPIGAARALGLVLLEIRPIMATRGRTVLLTIAGEFQSNSEFPMRSRLKLNMTVIPNQVEKVKMTASKEDPFPEETATTVAGRFSLGRLQIFPTLAEHIACRVDIPPSWQRVKGGNHLMLQESRSFSNRRPVSVGAAC